MNNYGKKFFNVMVSALMMLAMAPTNLTTINADGTAFSNKVTYSDILGEAVNYGLTANKISLSGHIDSNFATKEYNKAAGENITLGAYSSIPGTIVAAQIDAGLKIETNVQSGRSNVTYVRCTEADKDKITQSGSGSIIKIYDSKENLTNYIENLMNHVIKKSTEIAGYVSYTYGDKSNTPTSPVPSTGDANDFPIDISGQPDGTYYISNSDGLFSYAAKLKIKKKDTQTIVFNFMGTSVNLLDFKVIDIDAKGNETTYESSTSNSVNDTIARTVIFNMPNATNFSYKNITGTVIAPKATLSLGGTSSGWLVCNEITSNNGEWHCLYGNLTNTENPGNLYLHATKSIEGATPTKQNFNFKLTEYSDNTYTQELESATTQNDKGFVQLDFTSLGFSLFNEVNTRYFTLTENDTSGYEKNDTIYYIVVDTTAEQVGNNISYYPKATIYNSSDVAIESMAFNNIITKNVFASISVSKKLTGRDWKTTGDSYKFKLTAGKNDTAEKVATPTTEENEVVISAKDTVASFGELEFIAAGTYHYVINEELPEGSTTSPVNGVSYDTSDHEVTVVVSDKDHTGNLTAEVSYEDGKTVTIDSKTAQQITNTYSASGTTARLSGTKYLNGRNFKDGDTFTFEISNPKDVKQPLPGNTSVTINPTSGTSKAFNFDSISYEFKDLNGQNSREFVYYITETAKIAGVTNDTAVHKATVTLKDNLNGTMSTSVTYDEEKVSALNFVNSYNASGEFTLSATKSISGRDWNDDDSFTFHVVPEVGSPAVENSSATATKKTPVASFGKITFAQAGTYKYDITEEIPEGATKTADGQYVLKGVVYDSTTHVVTITVVDNGDGTLTATSDASTSLKVTNSYTDIKVNKYDSDGNKLNGAELALYEADSKEPLVKWTSGEDAESLGDYLVRGSSYVIRELSAPAGYGTFEDIKFTLNADGTVTGLDKLTKDADGAYELIDAVLDVRFAKIDTDGKALSGATLQLLDENKKVVDEWQTDGTEHVVKGLTAGSTYTLHEVSAPARYTRAADITFTVKNTKDVQVVTMTDEKITTPATPSRPTTPNTGDRTNLPLSAAGMLLGTLAAVFVLFFKKKYSL